MPLPRRRVVFKWKKNMASIQSQSSLSDVTNRIEEIFVADSEADSLHMRHASTYPAIPKMHTTWPVVRDHKETETLRVQDETTKSCLPFLKGNPARSPLNRKGIPGLQRENHVAFLRDALEEYPAPYVAMDASRPWIYYWALTGLSALGENVEEYRDR